MLDTLPLNHTTSLSVAKLDAEIFNHENKRYRQEMNLQGTLQSHPTKHQGKQLNKNEKYLIQSYNIFRRNIACVMK